MGLVSLLTNRLLALSASSHLSTICVLLCRRVSYSLSPPLPFFHSLSLTNPYHFLVFFSSQLESQSGMDDDRPGRQTEDNLTTYIYPVLSAFCTYGAHLDRAAKVL